MEMLPPADEATCAVSLTGAFLREPAQGQGGADEVLSARKRQTAAEQLAAGRMALLHPQSRHCSVWTVE